MTIQELNIKYHKQLSSIMGDEELRYYLLSPIFQNLFQNKVVYHERFTCLVQLTDLEISPKMFRAKVTRLSLINSGSYRNRPIPEKWVFGANWAFIRLIGECMDSYAGWIMWPDPVFVEKVEKLIIENKTKEAYQLTIGRL